MVKKKRDILSPLAGYIPASYSPEITGKEIKIIPPYPDRGVRFERFFKEVDKEFYSVKPQTPIHFITAINQAAGSGTPLIYTVPSGKKFYISKIIYARDPITTSTLSYLVVKDRYSGGFTGNKYLNIPLPDIAVEFNFVYTFDFVIPLEILTGVELEVFANTGSERGNIHFFGWLE